MGKVRQIVGGAKDLVGGILGSATGETGAQAAVQGSQIQAQTSREAIEFQREALSQVRGDLAPFRDIGLTGIDQLQGAFGQLQSAIDDPSASVINNPFFQALAGDQEQRLLASQAARGKVGSGGTEDQLQRNLLLLGNQFAQQNISNIQGQVGNFQNLATLGANAAAQTGTATQQTAGQVGNLITGIGNAQAAGLVGAANSRQQAISGLIGGGIGLGSAALLCDQRLKENITFSHKENGINIYNWDWTEEGKELAGSQGTQGPIAQELRLTHPEMVIFDQEIGYFKVLM